MTKNYSLISLPNLVIFLALFAASCQSKNEDGAAFRIVGLNGKAAHPIRTRVPELNARILESQGKAPTQNISAAAPQQEISQNSGAQNSAVQSQSTPNSQVQNQQVIPAQNGNFTASNTDAIRNAMNSEANPSQSAPTYNLSRNETAPSAPTKAESMTSAGETENKEQEIQYEISDSKQESGAQGGKKMKLKVGATALMRDEKVVKEVEESAAKERGIFVQTGSFSNEENAKQALKSSQKFYKGRIEEGGSAEKKIYRVLLGPFANDAKAKAMVHKIKSAGRDAIVVKNK